MLIEEHELTLPPAAFPWDGTDRRREVWSRTQSLRDAAGAGQEGAAALGAPGPHPGAVVEVAGAAAGMVRVLSNFCLTVVEKMLTIRAPGPETPSMRTIVLGYCLHRQAFPAFPAEKPGGPVPDPGMAARIEPCSPNGPPTRDARFPQREAAEGIERCSPQRRFEGREIPGRRASIALAPHTA